MRYFTSSIGHVALLALAVGATRTAAAAVPTPIPGGSNGTLALSGHVGKTLWNGKVRVKITSIAVESDAEAAPLHPQADQKVIRIRGLVRNGTADSVVLRPSYVLADGDDVTVAAGVLDLKPVSLAPGAAGRQDIQMIAPRAFKPVKLLVGGDGTLPGKPFRIMLPQALQ